MTRKAGLVLLLLVLLVGMGSGSSRASSSEQCGDQIFAESSGPETITPTEPGVSLEPLELFPPAAESRCSGGACSSHEDCGEDGYCHKQPGQGCGFCA
jgi:hypothetical protein